MSDQLKQQPAFENPNMRTYVSDPQAILQKAINDVQAHYDALPWYRAFLGAALMNTGRRLMQLSDYVSGWEDPIKKRLKEQMSRDAAFRK
jgi:hypothetical protein